MSTEQTKMCLLSVLMILFLSFGLHKVKCSLSVERSFMYSIMINPGG